jgi:SAM-dependent methyltransferase
MLPSKAELVQRVERLISRSVRASRRMTGRGTGWLYPVIGPLTTGFDETDGNRRIIAREDPDTIIARDGLPLPPQHLWKEYGTTEERYLELADLHTSSMLSILRAAGFDLDAGQKRILDFGCAAGPMLRRLKQYADTNTLWGTDIDANCIDWCRRHLPMFRFATNSTAPHLPFEDRSFDLVYVGSVFSHIVEAADSWLLELARILKPGGLLYASIHDREFIENTLLHAPDWRFSKEIKRRMPASDFAMFVLGSGPNSNVFYERKYFLTMAQPAFDLVSANDRAYGNQSVMLLRKRA